MIEMKDKVVLVTGGSRGIGRGIAEMFAGLGAKVVICGTNAEKLQIAVSEMSAQGSSVLGFVADVSSAEDAQGLIQKVIDNHGRIDILVNNAGITRDTLLMRMSDADWDDVLKINLKGVFNCTKAATKPMMKARYGRIINISSVVGLMGNVGQANYAASKAGVIGFSKSVAKEIASRNITVNVIAPGYIETEMTEAVSEKVTQAMLDWIPQKRFGSVQDVASAVVFLASDQASYITGQVLNVDGGLVMA